MYLRIQKLGIRVVFVGNNVNKDYKGIGATDVEK